MQSNVLLVRTARWLLGREKALRGTFAFSVPWCNISLLALSTVVFTRDSPEDSVRLWGEIATLLHFHLDWFTFTLHFVKQTELSEQRHTVVMTARLWC